ncbi:MAG: methyltransferase domain-containing protein [Fulvivirga sp.]
MTPYEQALSDYFETEVSADLILHNSYGEPELMPVEVFFRSEEDFTDLDNIALSFCQGRTLDVGAGTGVHSAVLQAMGHDVTAVEISKFACTAMKSIGIKNVINKNLYDLKGEKFDTLLILMNGFGLCGKVSEAPKFFKKLRSLLNPGGIAIVDSSDVAYMYDEIPKEPYYGEVQFCYEYKHIVGEWFNWLYIDPVLLTQLSNDNEWHCQIVHKEDNDQYLAILTPYNYD